MPLRFMQVVIATEKSEKLKTLIRGESIVESWDQITANNRYKLSILIDAEESEHLISKLEQQFSNTGSFRIILFPVEATVPRISEPEQQKQPAKIDENKKTGKGRISSEELYHDLVDSTRLNTVFAVLMLASTSVASTGILRDSEAIIIGSMVIAPLLGPNVALSLATTLADFRLAQNALKVTVVGIGISLIFSVTLAFFMEIDTEAPQIANRTKSWN